MFQVVWSAATLHVEQQEKKNRESNTEIFRRSRHFLFFFSVMLGPIKEPCEGPLEKASSSSSKCIYNR